MEHLFHTTMKDNDVKQYIWYTDEFQRSQNTACLVWSLFLYTNTYTHTEYLFIHPSIYRYMGLHYPPATTHSVKKAMHFEDGRVRRTIKEQCILRMAEWEDGSVLSPQQCCGTSELTNPGAAVGLLVEWDNITSIQTESIET